MTPRPTATEAGDDARAQSVAGRCTGIGVGPGDPELLTLKALRVLQDSPVVAYFSALGRPSNARRTVDGYLKPDQAELHFVYPLTTGAVPAGSTYDGILGGFYDAVAEQVGDVLDTGRDVAVLCEGDPLFHGSFMYVLSRLAGRYRVEVVPGVPSMLAAAAAIGAPLACRDEVCTVVSGTLPTEDLTARLRAADAAVVMKVGRNLASVRAALDAAGLLGRAWYVERVTMDDERVLPLADVDADTAQAPYFSMVVVPGTTAPTR